MDIKFATNTTVTLLNQLGRSSNDELFEIDSSNTSNLSDNYSSSGVSIDNYHTLVIRDTAETGGFVYGAISLYSQQLNELSNYLIQLRDKELEIIGAVEGSAQHAQLVDEKDALEQTMSAFIGSQIHGNELDIISVKTQTPLQQSFMDVLSVYSDPTDTNSDLIGMISSVEVDMLEVFSNSHNPSTCPHCISNLSDIQNSNEDIQNAIATSNDSTYTTDTFKTTFAGTNDQQVEALRSGSKWNIGPNGSLTYSYYEGALSPDYITGYRDGDTASGANGLEVGITETGPDNTTALDLVMASWDKAIEFDFQKLIEDPITGAVGDIRMAFTSDGAPSGRAAFAYYPSNTAIGGDVWFETHDIDSNFDINGNDFDPTGLGDGGYSYYAALHEVGHALGLSHPFLNAEGSPSATSGVVLPNNEDNMRTSVMSYTQMDRNLVFQYTTNPNTGNFWTGDSYRVYATTPMLADVKAMDLMYGGETTSDGDTIYRFDIDPDRNQSLMMQTIIDTGGVDTIDLSNQTRTSYLDMRPGTLSDIGVWTEAEQVAYFASVLTANGYLASGAQSDFDFYNNQATTNYPGKTTSAIYTGDDNLAIAHNALIENAIGGQGDDFITGNDLDNMITGGAGNDDIDGGDGDDIAIYTGDRYSYNIENNGDGSYSVNGLDGQDTIRNVEILQFRAGNASARGASARTSLNATADLSGVSTFNISIDGEEEVAVTFNGQDYTAGGLTIENLMSDLQSAINSALTNAGQATSVTVARNSPIQIISNNDGANSAVQISSLSGPLQAALGDIETDQRIQVDDTVYYGVASGWVSTTPPSGNFVLSAPVAPDPGEEPVIPAAPNNSGSSSQNPSSGQQPEVGNAAGLPSHIGGISLATQEDAAKAVIVLDRAIEQITQSQAKLGAIQNRLDYNISNLTKSSMLTESAKGRITDADFAAETAILVKNQILAQAATQALNMANQSRQGVIGLLG